MLLSCQAPLFASSPAEMPMLCRLFIFYFLSLLSPSCVFHALSDIISMLLAAAMIAPYICLRRLLLLCYVAAPLLLLMPAAAYDATLPC